MGGGGGAVVGGGIKGEARQANNYKQQGSGQIETECGWIKSQDTSTMENAL